MENIDVRAYKLKGGMRSRESPLLVVDNPIHYHDEHFELEIVTSGTGKMLFNEKEFNLSRGDIYLMRPTDRHGHTSNGLVFRQIETKENILPKWIINKAYEMNNPILVHADEEETKTIIFLMQLLEKELHLEIKHFESNAISLVELIYSHFFRLVNANNENGDEIVSKILLFLQLNNRFTQKITLDEIANHVGYSKYYISSLFHKNFGKTLQDHIVDLRLEYSKKLLLQSNMSIAEVIFESGFSTSSNFYIQFAKAYGCSPLEYKRNNKKYMIN